MQFQGISANGGQISGPVCIVNDVSGFAHCQPENIVLLVCVKPNASLVNRVKGILSVHGGVTSHAAIVAREANKPAVVGLPEEMTKVVTDGQMITVDATKGTVTI